MIEVIVSVVLFVLLVATRRRLDAVETRAKLLEANLSATQAQLDHERVAHHARLARVESAVSALTERTGPREPPGLDGTRADAAAQPGGAAAAVRPDGAAASAQPDGAPSAAQPGGAAAAAQPDDAAAAVQPDSGAAAGAVMPRPEPADALGSPSDGAAAGRDLAADALGPRVPSERAPAPASTGSRAGALAGAAAGGGGRGAPPLELGHAPGPDPIRAATAFVRELFLGGNTVVRAGIVVLLVGVVLLLRWAAEQNLFPIELRLAASALLALGLIGLGFRQRVVRPGFALTLQGGGVAALYLVVFFAFRSYQLLPPALAFGLLVAIALSSGVLAVVQDSLSLILIAQVFGFLAPLVASTGQGSHVALFSYYLLLNLVVAGVAWFKAWRALNLVGFAFTFGVATGWGVLRYTPEHFASTEPFLIAFFLLYVAIPALFALRHPGTPRGWVDGSLVFGTPLAALGLQWSLVHEIPFGMAYSALGMGAVYLLLARIMRRHAPERLLALAEAFLPIGVCFATLAIPYGFDNHNLTGAAWALEGAGLYWLGVRQRRWLSRLAGGVLQLLAGAAIVLDPVRTAGALPLLNTGFLAGLLLGLSSLFIARVGFARRAELASEEWRLAQVLIGWGLWFVVGSGLVEIAAEIPAGLQPGVQLAWLALVGLGLELVAARLAWTPGRYPVLLLWPVMLLALLEQHVERDVQPLADGGFLGWPLLALAMFRSLRSFVDRGDRFLRYAHPGAFWLWVGWLGSLAAQLVEDGARLDASYVFAAGSSVIALAMLATLSLAERPIWPFVHQRRLYLSVGLGGLATALLLRTLTGNLALPGSSAPLPYLPLVNALDIATLLGLAVIAIWWRRGSAEAPPLWPAAFAPVLWAAVALLAFLFWNALLARSVHHFAGVRFDFAALWDAVPLQVSLTLSWTLIALAVMTLAHRRSVRVPWFCGAALLAVVVAKLFVLDLASLSAPAKIGTFLGAGVLLLLVGYVAPVPPSAAAPATTAGGGGAESS